MAKSNSFDGFSNYGGPTEEEWCDFVVLIGQNRDSDILTQSNFRCALERLGGESKNVVVNRFGHWACGWIELILVNPNSKKIQKAYDIYKSLQKYPVLDDGDFSEAENEYRSEYAEGSKDKLAKAISKHFKVKNTKKLVQLCFDLQVECQAYYGDDACVDIYDCREPDERDCERLANCLQQIEYGYENSRVFKELKNSVAVYRLRFLDIKVKGDK